MTGLDTRWLGGIALALLLGASWAAWYPVARAAWIDWNARSRAVRIATLLAILATYALLLRPHEDTFSGLDASGYRHMASAFRNGRGLHDPDSVLLLAPAAIRNAFLLLPDMQYRNTRDRSFQILSLSRAETEPFFYPLAPLAASAFDRLIPGGRDYLLPLLHASMLALLLLTASAQGGGWGLLVALALALGSPMPAWFLRGYFPEALGTLLIAGAALQTHGGRAARFGAAFAVGMAISLHPMLVVLAAPALGLLMFSGTGVAASLAGFAAGTAPIVLMTSFVCRPYGNILRLDTVRFNMGYSGEHRVVIVFAALAALAMAAAWIAPRAFRRDFRSRVATCFDSSAGRATLAVVALLPTAAALLIADIRPEFVQGAREAWQAVRLPLGVLFALLAAAAVVRSDSRHLLVLGVAVAVLPVFFYLKGAEVPGLWHQRRLLPGLIFLIAACVPATASISSLLARTGALKPLAAALAALAVLAAMLANPIRWPAPYIVRNEAGAQEWFDSLARETAGALTIFDYHAYSFPLAVDLRRPVLGIGERAQAFVPDVMRWLAAESRTQEVRLAAAYANPGVEEGLCLLPGPIVSAQVMRIRSKGMLPAVAEPRAVSVELLTVRTADDCTPRLHKVFDGGPLALRGPWVPRIHTLRNDARENVPAQWFRTGAGVIGPVPHEGERLLVTVHGVAGQRDRAARQQIEIQDESGGRLGVIELAHEWTIDSVEISARGAPASRTALYRLVAPAPYNPGKEGLRGYHHDLGALVHRIDMEVVPAHTPPHD